MKSEWGRCPRFGPVWCKILQGDPSGCKVHAARVAAHAGGSFVLLKDEQKFVYTRY